MALYSTIPAPAAEAAVDEESLLNTTAKKPTRKWAATLAAVCLASALVGSATPGAVGKLYNLATSSVTLVDSQRLRDPTQNQAVPIRAVAMTQAGDGGSTQMVATASGNNYFSGTSYDGGSGRQRSDSRQLGRYEWIATYEGLSIYGHTSDNKVFIRPREGCTQNGVSYCCEIPYANGVPRNQNSWVAVLDASTKPDGCRLSFATYKGGENNNPTGLVMYTGDERSGLTQSNEITLGGLRTNSMIAAPAPARAIFLGGVDSSGRAGALRIDYNINRQGPIPVYRFRGTSPTWTTTAPNVRSTPGPVVSNGKWLAIPSQGFSVLLDVETGEVVPGSYNSRSNIYLPENTTPIATMGRYDGNAAVFLDYIFSVGISNIRVVDPTTGALVKELGFKQAVPSGCQSDNRVLAKGITVLETIPGTTWVALSMECRDGNYVMNLKLDV